MIQNWSILFMTQVALSQRKLMALQAGMCNSVVSTWQAATYWGTLFAAIGVQESSPFHPW
jgi:hypothetical protein